MRFTHAAALALFAMLASLPLRAGLSAQGYITPSYIDFEITELSAAEDDAQVTVVVYRTGEFREKTFVDFQTAEDTATQGRDYAGTGGTLVFQPGESFKSINVRILGDELEEEPEAFFLKLSAESEKVVFMRTQARITIEDARLGAKSAEPMLAIRAEAPEGIVLSWSGPGDYQLEKAGALAGAAWVPVLAEPAYDGSRWEVREALGAGPAFYRLRRVN